MQLADGALEPVRCGASNRCTYCAMFAAIEASLVLGLDAQVEQPTVGMTTTTRTAGFGWKQLRTAEAQLWKQLRKELEPVTGEPLRYCAFLEWTTGAGTHSGGHRRPHLHHLLKGLPAEHELLQPAPVTPEEYAARVGCPVPRWQEATHDIPALELRVAELWYRYTEDAWIADCRRLRTPAGAIAYLSLHHHKREQAPTPGFRGRRLRPSVLTRDKLTGETVRPGYYERPIPELRALARKLAKEDHVRRAVARVLDVGIFGEKGELDLDVYMSAAIEAALGGFRPSKPAVQLDLPVTKQPAVDVRAVDKDVAREELAELVLVELQRVREEKPPVLVRVSERASIDAETGEVRLEAVKVLGLLHPKPLRSPGKPTQLRLAEEVAA